MRMSKLINNIFNIKMKIGKQNSIIGKSYYKIKPHYSEILKKSLLNNIENLKLTSGKERKEIRNKKFLNITSNI